MGTGRRLVVGFWLVVCRGYNKLSKMANEMDFINMGKDTVPHVVCGMWYSRTWGGTERASTGIYTMLSTVLLQVEAARHSYTYDVMLSNGTILVAWV